MLILFDWDGTIAKKEIADEAALRRLTYLGIKKSKSWIQKAQKTHAHYDVTKAAISSYTGVDDDRTLTIMMTNLFQLHYLAVVKEKKTTVLYPHFHTILERIKDEFGIKYGIVSTLRQDIIEPALITLGIRHLFEYVAANTPDLQYTKTNLAKQVAQKERPFLIIGDRKDDMLAGKELGIKTALATWGHGQKEDTHYADYVLNKPQELAKILRTLLTRKN